jgi:hypothetical protein
VRVIRTDRRGSIVRFAASELRVLREATRWLLDQLPDTGYGRGEFSAWIGDRSDAVSLLDVLERCTPGFRVHLAAVDVHHAVKVTRHVLMLSEHVRHVDPPFDPGEAELLIAQMAELDTAIRRHGGPPTA